jgi:L,D-transpeptidase ErfK/SrfK
MRVPMICCLVLAAPAWAETYPMPPDDEDLVGEEQYTEVARGETLVDIARRAGVGYEELIAANPALDHWLPKEGASVLLPTRHVLPPGPREGIVVNRAEMRLYYFMPGSEPTVMTFPVAVGREDWPTPTTQTKVAERVRNPVWTPPADIKVEHAERDDPLPPSVPPGPDNPLGPLALRLALPQHLIHGTNKLFGIGMRVTHGCIRLYPEHMQELFDVVPKDTPVRLVDVPFKAGWGDGSLWLQASGDVGPEPAWKSLPDLFEKAARGRPLPPVDWNATYAALSQAHGMPVRVARRDTEEPVVMR